MRDRESRQGGMKRHSLVPPPHHHPSQDDGSPELVAQNVLAISLALLLAAALGGMALRVLTVATALAAAALRYTVIAVLLLFFAIVFTPRR